MKRIIAMAICIALIATMAISGSVAYLVDEEKDTNIFQVGTVNIVQHEQQRDGEDLEPFVDPTNRIHPMVETNKQNVDKTVSQKFVNGNYTGQEVAYSVNLRNHEYYANYIDKIVTVENEGASNAYVRNIVAIPTGLPKDAVGVDWLEVDWFDMNDETTSSDWEALEPEKDVLIDGRLYDIYVFNYQNEVTNDALLPHSITRPTLLGIGLSKHVGYDESIPTYYYQEPNGTRTNISFSPNELKILVATQAVQTAGFENFDHAFEQAFNGKITDKNHPWYDPNAPKPSYEISGNTYLGDALPHIGDGYALSGAGKENTILSIDSSASIIEADDLTIEDLSIETGNGSEFTVIGDNLELKNSDVLMMSQNSGFGVRGTGATISNAGFYGGPLRFYAEDSTDTETTVSNCKFDSNTIDYGSFDWTFAGDGIKVGSLNGTFNISDTTFKTFDSALDIGNSGKARGSVNVTGSTINSWEKVSIINVNDITFKNCTIGNTWTEEETGEAPGPLKVAVTAANGITFEACHFSSQIDLIHDSYPVTFKNCTFGESKTTLTAENFSQIFTCKNGLNATLSCSNHPFANS